MHSAWRPRNLCTPGDEHARGNTRGGKWDHSYINRGDDSRTSRKNKRPLISSREIPIAFQSRHDRTACIHYDFIHKAEELQSETTCFIGSCAVSRKMAPRRSFSITSNLACHLLCGGTVPEMTWPFMGHVPPRACSPLRRLRVCPNKQAWVVIPGKLIKSCLNGSRAEGERTAPFGWRNQTLWLAFLMSFLGVVSLALGSEAVIQRRGLKRTTPRFFEMAHALEKSLNTLTAFQIHHIT